MMLVGRWRVGADETGGGAMNGGSSRRGRALILVRCRLTPRKPAGSLVGQCSWCRCTYLGGAAAHANMGCGAAHSRLRGVRGLVWPLACPCVSIRVYVGAPRASARSVAPARCCPLSPDA